MRGVITVILVVGVLIGILWMKSGSSGPQEQTGIEFSKGEQKATAPAALPKARQIYTSPRAPLADPGGAKTAHSAVCVKFWNDLRGLNLSQGDLSPPPTTGCDTVPEPLKRWHDEFTRVCAGAPDDDCRKALFHYRAAATELLTLNTPLKEITDPKVLADKMQARLQSGSNPGKVADAAERLFEIDSGLTYAARAAAVTRLHDAQAAVGRPDDPRWGQLEQALERGMRSDSDPRPYLETRMMMENLRSDPNRVRETASEIARKYPRLGVGPYQQAWLEYEQGNRARAEEFLHEAIRREPTDRRYMDSLEGLKRGEEHAFLPGHQSFSTPFE